MAAPAISAADFAAMAQALLPRGRVWNRDATSLEAVVLLALSAVYARTAARASGLLVDAFPATTNELLTEWEETLGLPDPCAGVLPSIVQRVAQVVARFTDRGGQNPAAIVAYAAALGFTVTITEFAPARIGHSHIGDPMTGVEWGNSWAVNAPLVTYQLAEIGRSVIGDPLAAFGNAVLECEIRARAPAHTIVSFRYI